jgi:hypothetical protein
LATANFLFVIGPFFESIKITTVVFENLFPAAIFSGSYYFIGVPVYIFFKFVAIKKSMQLFHVEIVVI